MKRVTYTIQIDRDNGIDEEDDKNHANELAEMMSRLLTLFEFTTMEVREVSHDDEAATNFPAVQ